MPELSKLEADILLGFLETVQRKLRRDEHAVALLKIIKKLQEA